MIIIFYKAVPKQGFYKTKPTKFQDFSRISRSFLNSFPGFVCTKFLPKYVRSYYNNMERTISLGLLLLNVTTSLLTLTEAEIYWQGRYSLRSYSLYRSCLPNYRSCLPNPQNINKCRQISTLLLFFQDSQQNSRVFPGIPGSSLIPVFLGYPGFPGSVDTLLRELKTFFVESVSRSVGRSVTDHCVHYVNKYAFLCESEA